VKRHSDSTVSRLFATAILRSLIGSSLLGAVAVPCGAQQQYAQSTVATISNGGNVKERVYQATDGQGNIYISEYDGYEQSANTYVKEVPNGKGGYTEVTLPFAGYSYGNVAADASGKLYLSSETDGYFGSGSIVVYTPSGNTYTATGSVRNLGEGPIAVDGNGNIFGLQNTTGSNDSGPENYGYQVSEASPSGGGNYTTTIRVPFGSFKGTGIGLGVDGSGSFYYVDSLTAGSTIYKQTPSGNTFIQSVVGTIPTAATTLTADSTGNVYVASSNGRIYKETLSGGTYTQSVVLSEFYAVFSIVVLADNSLSVYGGYNLIVVEETPLPTAISTPTSFAPVQVAGTPSTGTVQFSFDTAGALAAIPYSIFTSDYTAAASQPSGACVAGHNYAVGDTCSVGINFTATAPGNREGGLTLYGADGQPLGSAPLNGTGISPLALIYPGVSESLVTGFVQQPIAIALDAAGNIYLDDQANSRILKESLVAGSYVQKIVATDTNYPSDVVVDGAGNLYIADSGNNRVLKETPYNGGYIESNVITGSPNYFAPQPSSVAVDASGDVFVVLVVDVDLDPAIIRETLSSTTYNPTVVKAAGTAQSIRAITADGQGNVYATTLDPTGTVKETLSNGAYTETKISTYSGSYIAVDDTGSLYVQSINGISKIAYSNGNYGVYFFIPGVSLGSVYAVALDANENIYAIARPDPAYYEVDEIDTHHTATITFGSVSVGSSVNTYPVTLVNAGNSDLIFSAPASGVNPAFSSNSFLSGPNTTCPSATPGTSSTLSAGTSCLEGFTFAPKQAGLLTATDTFTDNSLNAQPATQVINLTGTGTGGLSISPTTLAFTSTAVSSTSAVLTATISNSGTAVTLSTGTLTDATDFTTTNNCGGAIADNATCTVSFTFTPKSAAALTSTFSIGDANNPGTSLSVALSGTGTAAPTVTATLSPSTHDFGSAVAGTPSPAATQTFTLTNTGTVTLTNTIAITGTNSGAFTFTANACGSTLAAGANCTMTILFNPGTPGSYAATLAVASVNGATTINESAALTGTGLTPPTLTAAPNPAAFPATAVNTTATMTVKLTDTGAGVLNFQTTIGTLGGADHANFTVGSACGYSLQPTTSCNLTVTFTPNAVRTFNATFTIPSNDPNSPTVINLTGGGAGLLSIAPMAQTFSSAPVGSASAALTSVIANGTAQAVYLSSAALTDASDFAQTDNCNGLVDAGKTCTVSFTFTPKSTGALTSTYSIHDLNNPGSPLTVALSGTATAALIPQAVLSPTALAFTTTANTQAYNQTISLSNPGTAPLSISSITLGGANLASFSIVTNSCGNSVAAGSSCKLVIGCTAITVGEYDATLTVADNATPMTQAAALTCNVNGVAQATLTPASLTFTASVGTTAASQILTLANSGTAALTISSIAVNGTNASAFTIAGNTCGSSLAAAGSCTVSVTFTPAAATTYPAMLAIVDSVGTQSSTLSGTGTPAPAPQASLTAAADFGSVQEGSSATKTLTLTNAGTASLAITAYSVTAGGVQFIQGATSCSSTLAANSSCTFAVAFTPNATGQQTGTFSVTDAVGTQTSALSGTGTVALIPQASLAPAALSFNTTTGTPSAAQNLTLSNTGNSPLTVTSIALNGTNASAFTQTSTCGASLAAGANCTIAITFNSSAAGTFSAGVVVTDNSGSTGAVTTTQSAALMATATAPAAPQAALSPTSSSFDSTVIGTSSTARTFILSNAGNAPLAITSISLSGTNASSFAISSNTCGSSLAAGANCTLGVLFSPGAVGAFSASLNAVDAVGTQMAALTGTGAAAPNFTIAATPAAQSTYRGTNVTYNVQLASLAGASPFTSVVTLSVAGLPMGATASFSPATVVPGAQASTTLTVTVPALSAQSTPDRLPASPGRGTAVTLALICGAWLFRRKRLASRLLLSLVAIALLSSMVTGCGTGTGFAVSSSTSTLTVTGTAGATSHATTVTLTIK
jgi:hypothetical protein